MADNTLNEPRVRDRTPGLTEPLPDDAKTRSPDRYTEPAREKGSFTELLRELRDESSLLLRQEVALAKTEMSEKASKLGRNAAYIGAGALVGLLGLAFILTGVSYLLSVLLARSGVSEGTAYWVGPMIVGLITAIVGYILVQKGISTLKRESMVPEKTVATLKEDKQWLQNKVA